MHTPPAPYQPDDSSLTPALLDALLTRDGQSLFAEILARPDLTVAHITRLRKSHSPELVHAALVLAKLQPTARDKFPNLVNMPPSDPSILFATPESLQQASSFPVASHKALRFALLHPTEIFDLCSGIGGDSIPLASLSPTTSVDLSPTRLHCLTLNARHLPLPLTTLSADVTTLPIPPHALIHIDPARRTLGKRTILYQDMIPSPAFLNPLIAKSPALCLKLSPAVDFPSLPPGHLELLSENRTVVQALLWTGTFLQTFPSPTARTATLFSTNHAPFSFTALPSTPTSLAPSPLAYLYELDGALTRSQLAAPFAAQHNLLPLTQDCGYVTSSSLLQHPAAIPFEVLTTFPFTEKRAAEILRAHQSAAPNGPVEIKTRGLPHIDTDALQKKLTEKSPLALTLLLYRNPQNQLTATLAKRPPRSKSQS